MMVEKGPEPGKLETKERKYSVRFADRKLEREENSTSQQCQWTGGKGYKLFTCLRIGHMLNLKHSWKKII